MEADRCAHEKEYFHQITVTIQQTSFITENNVRRTNPMEERLWGTKNDVLGLVTEDEGRYYWI